MALVAEPMERFEEYSVHVADLQAKLVEGSAENKALARRAVIKVT